MKKYYFILFLCLSCQSKNSLQESEIGMYLEKTHHILISSSPAIYFFIPSNSCSSCQEITIEKLKSLSLPSQNYSIVLCGNNKAEVLPFRLSLKSQKGKLLEDIGFSTSQYASLIHNCPFYVYIDKKNRIEIVEINAGNYIASFIRLDRFLSTL